MYRRIPPCPGNPEDYTLVKTRKGYYWRKRRGTIKKASLNTAFQANAEATKVVSPAAKRIMAALGHYFTGLNTGRLNIRIGKALRTSLKERGNFFLFYLKDMELQGEHPLSQLLQAGYRLRRDEESIFIDIAISPMTIKPQNRLVSHYYFEAVLLCGDAGKKGRLRSECVESALYSIGSEQKALCTLRLSLPKKEDWCLLLKISSLEGNGMALHTKHYRMKVVEARSLDGR